MLRACSGSKVTPIPTTPWDASIHADVPVVSDLPRDLRAEEAGKALAADRVPDGMGKDTTADFLADLSPSDTKDTAALGSRDVPGN